MKNKIYGVLKSKVTIDEGEFTSKKTHRTHYNLITIGGSKFYQVNIDIQSNSNSANVCMLCIDDYQNDIIRNFSNIGSGFTSISSIKDGLALDYLRQNLFPKEKLFENSPLSADNITEVLNPYLENHKNIIVFGTQYGPNYNDKNHYGTMRSIQLNRPNIGIDDIHLNQGSSGKHVESNGIYQDGALFVENINNSYTAFFFAFTEQCSQTDENGNCVD